MIEEFEFRRVANVFRQCLKTARGTWGNRESLVVRIRRPDGSIGYGEIAPTPGFRGESLSEAEAFLEQFDAQKQIPANLPLCSSAISCANSAVWSTSWVSTGRSLNPARLLSSLHDYGSISGKVVKAKIGLSEPSEEILALKQLLLASPSVSCLRLDANGSLSLKQAQFWVSELSGLEQVEYLEQPLPASEKETLLSLADSSPVPIALDESVADLAEAESFLERGWPGYFILKPTLCGDWQGLERFVQKVPERCVISTVFESSFGFEAILRIADVSETVPGLGVLDFVRDENWLHKEPVLTPGLVSNDRLEELWQTL